MNPVDFRTVVCPVIAIVGWFAACAAAESGAAEWAVPMGGNAFLVASKPGSNDGLQRGGADVRWHDPETTWTVWFHIDRPALVELALVSAETGGTRR